jgi:hypothetical protein
MEYVHQCINSLKPVQFVLVQKPNSIFEQKFDDRTFEEFCLTENEEYFQITKQQKYVDF